MKPKSKEEEQKRQLEYLKSLSKPKDKWKRGKVLMELRKDFPHDAVIERMCQAEFKDNQVFRYAPEYDVYNEQEDKMRKTFACGGIKEKDDDKGKALLDKFKEQDRDKQAWDKVQKRKEREAERDFHIFFEEKVIEYAEMKKHRKVLMRKEITGEEIKDEDREKLKTWRCFLAAMFREMEKRFAKQTKLSFPHLNYGTKKSSETYKKSFPNCFKVYFFQQEKAYHRKDG